MSYEIVFPVGFTKAAKAAVRQAVWRLAGKGEMAPWAAELLVSVASDYIAIGKGRDVTTAIVSLCRSVDLEMVLQMHSDRLRAAQAAEAKAAS